jgi:hypothetical protein
MMLRSLAGKEIMMLSAAPVTVGNTQPWPLQPLLDSMAQAARRNDRASFDRLFDCCFGWVYAVAWRVTGDAARAEAITAQVLRKAVIEAD